MEKFKLTEKQKYTLLQKSYVNIVSQGAKFYRFLSVYQCDSVKFNVGCFTKRNGCRIEVVYHYRTCVVRLLFHCIYSQGSCDFSFIPKAITIDRSFKGSILISIIPDDKCHDMYVYQSTKSIFELCEGDIEEGEAGVRDGVCHAEADDNSASDVNPYAVQNYHFEDENEYSVIL